MRSVPSAPLVGPFADLLLERDLPSLDPAKRGLVVAFVIRRVDGLPSVMHLGVLLIAGLVRAALVLPWRDAVVVFMARTTLPLLG